MSEPTQANTTDLQVPFDPTGYTEIDGAQLAQLVSGASPANGIGFIVVTADSNGNPNVPNAGTTTKWQSYMWLRVGATAVTAYIWNANAGTQGNLLQWVTISQAAIGPNTIQGYMIQANTIPASCIISLGYSQLTGAPAQAATGTNPNVLASDGLLSTGLFSNASFTWGVLQGTGSVPGTPTLAPGTIPGTALVAQSISGSPLLLTSPIKDDTITAVQLLNNGGNVSPAFQSLAAVDPSYNLSVPTKSIVGIPSSINFNPSTSGVAIAPGDVLGLNYNATLNEAGWIPLRKAVLTMAEPVVEIYPQIPVVGAGGTTYSLANAQGVNGGQPLGRILQQVVICDSTPIEATYSSTSSTITSGVCPGPSTTRPAITAIPSGATGALGTNTVLNVPALSNTFTPLSSTSTIVVEIEAVLSGSGAPSALVIALFANQAGTASAAVAANGNDAGSGAQTYLGLKYKMASTGTAIAFQTAFGAINGNAFYNCVSSNVSAWGGVTVSSMKITEYI